MRKQLPVPLSRVQVIAGWLYWGFQLVLLPTVLLLVLDLMGLQTNDAQLNFIFFCVNFLVTGLLLGNFILASLKIGLARPGYTFQSAALGLAGIQSSNVLFNVVVLFLVPEFANLNDNAVAALLEENYVLMALGVAFLAPVAEELLFRGVIFGSLYKRSKVAAYIVSSVAFSLVHLLGYLTMYSPLTLILSFLQYLPYGMCMGWAYARSGSILAPMAIHMWVNQLALIALLIMR